MEEKLKDVFKNLSDDEIIEISDIELNCELDDLTLKRIQSASLRKAGLSTEGRITKDKAKRTFGWKRAAVAAACVIIILGILQTTGSARYLINMWTSRVNIGDGKEELILNNGLGLIHIKETAPNKRTTDLTLKQAEDMIGVEYLKSPMFTTDIVLYEPIIVKKDIERVDVIHTGCVRYENGSKEKSIHGHYMLLTDKATQNVVPNEDIDAVGGKEHVRTYKSSALNTNVIIYEAGSQERLSAVFDYKDVHYWYTGNNVSEAEMMEFIETLK